MLFGHTCKFHPSVACIGEALANYAPHHAGGARLIIDTKRYAVGIAEIKLSQIPVKVYHDRMSSGIRILVVDDEPQIQRFLKLGLEAGGFAVSAAATAGEAIKEFY